MDWIWIWIFSEKYIKKIKELRECNKKINKSTGLDTAGKKCFFFLIQELSDFKKT